MLSYVLDLLESSNLKDLIVVRLISFTNLLLSYARLNVFNRFWRELKIFDSHFWKQVVEGEDAALTVGGYGYLLPVLIVYMFEVFFSEYYTSLEMELIASYRINAFQH